jgi:hypothetical protein
VALTMQIAFRKISGDRHVLAVVRDDGSFEQVECETRSYLLHDLLHYAVEAEAGLEFGFWGNVASGLPLAMRDERTGRRVTAARSAELAAIERMVGALTAAAKGVPAAAVFAGAQTYAQAAGEALPGWVTEAFVAAVQERMRRLLGQWRATAYGRSIELSWPSGE